MAVVDGSASAEHAFFTALSDCIPGLVRYNGNSGEAATELRALGLTFPNNHWQAELPAAVQTRLDRLLQGFGGARRDWPQGDLLAHVDGIVTGPPVGPCLVEFDEEQHFSPYRLASLDALSGIVETRFDRSAYRSYCTDPAAFRAFWRKSRLPDRLLPATGAIESTAQLAAVFFRNQHALPDSRYVRAVPGFPFAGGRIAQRAYYDSLLDCVHETRQWLDLGFRPVLRVAVWDILRIYRGTTMASGADLRRVIETFLSPASL